MWQDGSDELSIVNCGMAERHAAQRFNTRAPVFQVLVLAPTRELAHQVSKDFSDITKKLSVACFYGGTPYGGQSKYIQKLREGVVGAPQLEVCHILGVSLACC